MRLLLIFTFLGIHAFADPCVVNANCSDRQTCSDSKCICKPEYATKEADKPCGYERKTQKTAFLLAWFTGFWGVDQLYLHNYLWGLPKLLTGVLLYPVVVPLNIYLWYKNRASMPRDSMCLQGLSALLFAGNYAWWLKDVVLLWLNKMNDGYGISLLGWK